MLGPGRALGVHHHAELRKPRWDHNCSCTLGHGQERENQADAPRVAYLPKLTVPRVAYLPKLTVPHSFKGDNESPPGLARHHGIGLRWCLWLLAGQGRTGRSLLRRVLGGDWEGFPAAPSCVSARLQEQLGKLTGWLQTGTAACGCLQLAQSGRGCQRAQSNRKELGRRLWLSSVLLPWYEHRNEHPPASSTVAQEGQDFGIGDTSTVLGHPKGKRGRQESPVPAVWGERQQPLVLWGSPLFQQSTRQGSKEGN